MTARFWQSDFVRRVGQWLRSRSLAGVVSVVVGAGYFLVSRGVVNFFPFSVLDMYAHSAAESASRLFALDARGQLHELDHYARWDCPAALDTSLRACAAAGPVQNIAYVDRDLTILLDEHRGRVPDGEPVSVVRRVWRLTATPGPPPFRDCVLLRCRAARP